jgi:hypothetical protein
MERGGVDGEVRRRRGKGAPVGRRATCFEARGGEGEGAVRHGDIRRRACGEVNGPRSVAGPIETGS